MRKPNVDRRSLLLVLVPPLLLFLALCFLTPTTGRIFAATVTPVCAFLVFYFLKKMPFSSVRRRAVLLVVTLVAVLYTAIKLLSGLHFGFFLSDITLSFQSFLKYILPITVTVISTEITRGAYLGQKGFIPRASAFVFGLFSEVLLVTTFASATGFNRFMDLAGMALLPALAAQPLYQYTGKHYGPLPAIVYRLITALSPYLLPIKSGIPDSLLSFLTLFVPPVLLILLRILYGKSVKATEKGRAGKWTLVLTAFVLVFIVSFIMLISNEFKYRFLVIATESMTGSIDKGDGVIYEEYTDQFIDEQDVIVFYLDDRVTVHRVVDISRVNGKNRYFTKGDANDTLDRGYAESEDIIGIVRAKLPYFGYPTLWLRGLFE